MKTLDVRGFHWEKVDISFEGSLSSLNLFCSGREAYSGYLLLHSISKDYLESSLSCTNLHGGESHVMTLPQGEAVQDVGALPDALWLLTASGAVYIRVGFSQTKYSGTSWKKLNLSQIQDTRLKSISLATEKVWVVGSDGQIFLRLGSLAPPPSHACPAWVPIDSGFNVHFEKIVCSPEGDKVWALDTSHGIYAREGIYEEHPVGT